MRASERDGGPWIVAVTGGIGAGKSRVARAFARLGAHVIDADAIARAVVESPAVVAELGRTFGRGIFTPDGILDRRALADRVFADTGERERLNAIVHPEVRRRIDKELARLAASGSDDASPLPGQRPLVLLDIPLLETSPYHDRAQVVLFVDASPEDRRRRVAETRGWSAEELARRAAAQAPIAEKRRRANRILPNPDGTEEELAERCRSLLEEWRAELGARTEGSPGERFQGKRAQGEGEPD
jgi:dephospho-CoA kinase